MRIIYILLYNSEYILYNIYIYIYIYIYILNSKIYFKFISQYIL